MSSAGSLGDDYSKEGALGRVKLVRGDGSIILIPQPSSHLDDPLNWSKGFKYYVTLIACFGTLMSTLLATGPIVAIIQMAEDFDINPHANPNAPLFFTTSILAQGLGNLLWQPFISKYGRRPIYIISLSGFFLTTLWCGLAPDYMNELIARILLGFFSSAGETLGAITVSDLFFLHERAVAMSIYTFALSSGVSIGIIFSGVITMNGNTWRIIYFIGTLLIGILVLLIIFTFPETAYNCVYTEEDKLQRINTLPRSMTSKSTIDEEKAELGRRFAKPLESDHPASEKSTTDKNSSKPQEDLNSQSPPPSNKSTKTSYLSILPLSTNKTYTSQPLHHLLLRPLLLLCLPPILWATLLTTTTLSVLISLTTSYANSFAVAYTFTSFQSSLCFLSPLLFGFLAIPLGGHLTEWIADFLTKRNGGVRVAEFGLVGLGLGGFGMPVGLIVYGIGLHFKLSFWVPVLGLGLISFSVGQAVNISLIYTIDAYPSMTAEIITAQLLSKSITSFLLSTYTKTWMRSSGELLSLAEMAAISAFILALAFPMFIWGTRLRKASMKWRIMRFLPSTSTSTSTQNNR